jgi:hypothetical protein
MEKQRRSQTPRPFQAIALLAGTVTTRPPDNGLDAQSGSLANPGLGLPRWIALATFLSLALPAAAGIGTLVIGRPHPNLDRVFSIALTSGYCCGLVVAGQGLRLPGAAVAWIPLAKAALTTFAHSGLNTVWLVFARLSPETLVSPAISLCFPSVADIVLPRPANGDGAGSGPARAIVESTAPFAQKQFFTDVVVQAQLA